MRFMMLVIPHKDYEKVAPDFTPDPKAIELMGKYNESLQKAGVLLDLNGLYPPSAGTRISYADGKPKMIDGPFTEAKEFIGGYWIIQVKSKEEAIEWATRIPFIQGETVEIRQIHELAELVAKLQEAAGKTPGMK
jgi:hypothetical protein